MNQGVALRYRITAFQAGRLTGSESNRLSRSGLGFRLSVVAAEALEAETMKQRPNTQGFALGSIIWPLQGRYYVGSREVSLSPPGTFGGWAHPFGPGYER
jgi:hypothetical protein